MLTLVEVVLAKELVLRDGKRTLQSSIKDREEFECEVPSEFPVVLGAILNGEPNEEFPISTDVLSHMSQPIWSATESHQIGPEGKLEIYMPIPIPVLDVGPCYILLKLNHAEVWRQRIFFARSMR